MLKIIVLQLIKQRVLHFIYMYKHFITPDQLFLFEYHCSTVASSNAQFRSQLCLQAIGLTLILFNNDKFEVAQS